MALGFPAGLPPYCPYSDCLGNSASEEAGPVSSRFVRNGRYWRAEDSKLICRYKCLQCKRSFSSARFSACFGQKKRKVNAWVEKLYYSGVSQRRMARLLKLNHKTVERKIVFLGGCAEKDNLAFLKELGASEKKIKELQFDEMETFERSKCLPLSIPLAVLPGSRKILGFKIAEMPAKGPLAAISRKKYGKRGDERAQMAESLLAELKPLLAPNVLITTDQNPKYPGWIKPHFPEAEHIAVKGRRGCVVGQGELKKIGFDPLFDLNHSAAMLRANINRLFRRTWCTTKRRDRLKAHLELYIRFHNRKLTPALA